MDHTFIDARRLSKVSLSDRLTAWNSRINARMERASPQMLVVGMVRGHLLDVSHDNRGIFLHGKRTESPAGIQQETVIILQLHFFVFKRILSAVCLSLSSDGVSRSDVYTRPSRWNGFKLTVHQAWNPVGTCWTYHMITEAYSCMGNELSLQPVNNPRSRTSRPGNRDGNTPRNGPWRDYRRMNSCSISNLNSLWLQQLFFGFSGLASKVSLFLASQGCTLCCLVWM